MAQQTQNVSFVFEEDGSIQQQVINIDPQSEFVPEKPTKLSPFDFVNAINYSKEDMFAVDDAGERTSHSDSTYPKFLINRAMSYFADTIMFANVANTTLSNVPNNSHFDFYRLGVAKKKRFAKWAKPISDETIDVLCQYYQINIPKAIEVAQILTESQIETIRQKMNHGGRTTKTKHKI